LYTPSEFNDYPDELKIKVLNFKQEKHKELEKIANVFHDILIRDYRKNESVSGSCGIVADNDSMRSFRNFSVQSSQKVVLPASPIHREPQRQVGFQHNFA